MKGRIYFSCHPLAGCGQARLTDVIRAGNWDIKFRRLVYYPYLIDIIWAGIPERIVRYGGALCYVDNFFFKNLLPAADMKYFSLAMASSLVWNYSE